MKKEANSSKKAKIIENMQMRDENWTKTKIFVWKIKTLMPYDFS